MEKLYEAYARRWGVCPSSLRFLVDGERIHLDDTAEALGIQDNDIVYNVFEQNGC
jgi:small ubiquitin-related modifier